MVSCHQSTANSEVATPCLENGYIAKMSLVTKLAQLCIYLVTLLLFFLTFLEIIREPSSGKRKIQETISYEESHKYFQKLPGTNWTLFDIKFGSISDRQQPVGVDLSLIHI